MRYAKCDELHHDHHHVVFVRRFGYLTPRHGSLTHRRDKKFHLFAVVAASVALQTCEMLIVKYFEAFLARCNYVFVHLVFVHLVLLFGVSVLEK